MGIRIDNFLLLNRINRTLKCIFTNKENIFNERILYLDNKKRRV